MPIHYVFTTASLDRCLQMAPSDAWFASLETPKPGNWGLAVVRREETAYVVHSTDTVDSPRVILIAEQDTPVSQLPTGSLNAVFQRIHRVALRSANPPIRLPPA